MIYDVFTGPEKAAVQREQKGLKSSFKNGNELAVLMNRGEHSKDKKPPVRKGCYLQISCLWPLYKLHLMNRGAWKDLAVCSSVNKQATLLKSSNKKKKVWKLNLGLRRFDQVKSFHRSREDDSKVLLQSWLQPKTASLSLFFVCLCCFNVYKLCGQLKKGDVK